MTSVLCSDLRNQQGPSLAAVLRSAGLSSDEADGAVLVDVSRSHAVLLAVLPDGRRFAVKRRIPETSAGTRHLDAECFAYRLASWNFQLAGVIPHALVIDERRELLVTEACAPESL